MDVILTDTNGAQILPDVRDPRAAITAWAAHCAANADHRAKSPVYAELAARLLVRS